MSVSELTFVGTRACLSLGIDRLNPSWVAWRGSPSAEYFSKFSFLGELIAFNTESGQLAVRLFVKYRCLQVFG